MVDFRRGPKNPLKVITDTYEVTLGKIPLKEIFTTQLNKHRGKQTRLASAIYHGLLSRLQSALRMFRCTVRLMDQ